VNVSPSLHIGMVIRTVASFNSARTFIVANLFEEKDQGFLQPASLHFIHQFNMLSDDIHCWKITHEIWICHSPKSFLCWGGGDICHWPL
jgi:hypothetical protein